MSLLAANPFFFESTAAGGYSISRSVRFNSSDSAYLSRTPASAGNRKKWTYALWVKRSQLGAEQHIFSAGVAGVADDGLAFDSSDRLSGYTYRGSLTSSLLTTQVFRDASAWFHIVWAWDTDNATTAYRSRLYINGSEITVFSTGSYPASGTSSDINSNVEHSIGDNRPNFTTGGFNGYLADIHFIDGQALDPTSFGEFDDNGIWQPIAYSGTYGTNGFHLDFADNSTAAALGTDTSGNGNDWTVNNISVTTGFIGYYTGASNYLDAALDGIFGNGVNTDVAYTATFTNPIPYNSLLIVYGNMANGSLGNPASGAVLSVNGSTVAATGTYGVSPYNSSYAKYYETTTPGTLNSLGMSAAVSGSHQTGIYEIFVNGTLLVKSYSTSDSLRDSPKNGTETDTGTGNEVSGNYCTLNPLTGLSKGTFSDGNLNFTSNATNWATVVGTIAISSGKWYWEVTPQNNLEQMHGVLSTDTNMTLFDQGIAWVGRYAKGYGYYSTNGNKFNADVSSAYGASYTTNDIIGVALDLDNGTLSFYKNNSSQGTAYTGLSGTFFPGFSLTTLFGANSAVVNFGQRPFAYTAPSGFKALCTANLPAPVVTKPSTVMDVKLWTGNGSTQTISGLEFSPDLVWIKRRSAAASHMLYDTVRTLGEPLSSDTTAAEPSSTSGMLTALSSTGFTVAVAGGNNSTNGLDYGYVGWTWDAGSSTVTNEDGSIFSQVRANPSAGFSIVTYTGNATFNASIGHGLNVAPALVIIKNRSISSDWAVFTTLIDGSLDVLFLNKTDAKIDSGSNLPTSSVFYVGSGDNGNGNGNSLVAYCFAPVSGYSAMGSYTGNGSSDGPFVYTGFRPRWVMIKAITQNFRWWTISDSARSPFNASNAALGAQTSNQEVSTGPFLDLLSNGFKLRIGSADPSWNDSTDYLYVAFAENPFQYARAR